MAGSASSYPAAGSQILIKSGGENSSGVPLVIPSEGKTNSQKSGALPPSGGDNTTSGGGGNNQIILNNSSQSNNSKSSN